MRYIWKAGPGSVLHSLRHGHSRESPKKGHKCDEEPGTSDMQRKAERAGLFSPEKKRPREILTMCINTL